MRQRQTFAGSSVSCDCEIIVDEQMSSRGKKMLNSMASIASRCGINVICSTDWRGAAEWLMVYGIGHQGRRPWIEKHIESGGHMIGWDLGYWLRHAPIGFHMRLTIDHDHPWRMIEPENPQRLANTSIKLREDADPNGPIVLCGLGPKQRAWKRLQICEWEERTLRDLRAKFPNREIVYRPKIPDERLHDLEVMTGSIEEVLKGASLVVCQHSNVAVDACIAGVPVMCEDGISYALYRHGENPTREQRLDFLRSLAHWQYTPAESHLAWAFIKRKLCESTSVVARQSETDGSTSTRSVTPAQPETLNLSSS